ncbi:MAG: hypothetical protein A2X11_00105 [Bacteroidetes bacterium GWE2_42_24]|nr:MAG: hypothetical protein A2X11_00105 [Bacteroidetes bacterium GWE2_42_24]OFY27795.1 MAG: hypothetical protein A2X09_02795 [Bacteroidetes bacterium GWF2_43_11]
MRNLIFLTTLLVLGLIGHAQQQTYKRIKFLNTTENISLLKAAAVASEEIFASDDSLQLETNVTTANQLRLSGLNFRILIDDLADYYENRNANSTFNRPRNPAATSGLTPVPNGFQLGGMGGYCTYNQMLMHLDTMRARFPQLITAREPISSITTHNGNLIYYAKISDNPEINEDEPMVLFTGLTHAREPIGLQQMLFFMYHLLESYNSDPYIKALIDTTQIVFIPCMNPDGYLYNQQTNPGGGGMWRKNRLDLGNGNYGVDLNRNFGYMWGYDDEGSSPDPYSETYRGASAFSEPETQALQEFVNQRDFKICINYHSHGNLLIYPFGYKTLETNDSVTFHDFAYRISAFNGYSTGTPGELLYNTNGDINDWMYGESSEHPAIISLLPEVGNSYSDGFWPPTERIIPLCQENVPGNLRVLELAGWYAEAKDDCPMYLSRQEGYLNYLFVRQGLENNGTYTVGFSEAGGSVMEFGTPKTYINPVQYDTIRDSIWYRIVPNPEFPNQPVKLVLTVDDGYISRTDTIQKIIGAPLTAILNDDCSNMNNWTSPNWNTTTFYAHSPATSITDSPVGNYPSNTNRSIDLTNELIVDPNTNPFAMLSFWTRSYIQRGRDYVVVAASVDNGTTWQPLKGKHTHPGGMYQSIDTPVYDDFQDEWVQEEISLADFAQASRLLLRFTLRSDALINRDGFWFDDLKVFTRDNWAGTSEPDNQNKGGIIALWPNPATSIVNITTQVPEQVTGMLLVQNTLGQTILQKKMAKNGKTSLNLHTLPSGIYLVKLTDDSGLTISTKKLVIE